MKLVGREHVQTIPRGLWPPAQRCGNAATLGRESNKQIKQSQRDCVLQPKVGAPAPTLGERGETGDQPQRGCKFVATPIERFWTQPRRVFSRFANRDPR